MAEVHVYLENGFDHDQVAVSAGDAEHTEPDVSTRYQVGLASVVDLDVSEDAPVLVRVALPRRGLAGQATVDPSSTPHVRVDLNGTALDVRPQAEPPRFA